MNELKPCNQKTPDDSVFGKASGASLEVNAWAEVKQRGAALPAVGWAALCRPLCHSPDFLVEAWMGGD